MADSGGMSLWMAEICITMYKENLQIMNEMTKKVFINFSNHPSSTWSEPQIAAALQYADRIIDFPFPSVDPNMDESGLYELAGEIKEKILSMNPAAVMCQGEFGLSFAVIRRLLDAGVTVLHACSERNVTANGNVKTVRFDFVQFRRFG